MPSLELPGLLSATELSRTVDTIAEWQEPSGMIPWFPGGHADPWNHVEAAMALLVVTLSILDDQIVDEQLELLAGWAVAIVVGVLLTWGLTRTLVQPARIAARIRPQVNSAVAYDGVSAC